MIVVRHWNNIVRVFCCLFSLSLGLHTNTHTTSRTGASRVTLFDRLNPRNSRSIDVVVVAATSAALDAAIARDSAASVIARRLFDQFRLVVVVVCW
jgi:hypothetical protein